MIATALVALAAAWLLGVLAVRALWPRTGPLLLDLPLLLSLGLGVGLGLTSMIFFAASLLSEQPARVSAGLELLLGLALGWHLWRRKRLVTDPALAPAWWPSLTVAVVAAIFLQACVVATIATVRAGATEPYGSWDGWAIWNMHARFMFRGGGTWASVLRAPQLGWSHPDYPLLVPASVARVWSYAGQDAPWMAALVSTLFGVATVGLLVAATMRLRAPAIALVGGLVLLGTPFFVTFASNEHADIPLGFFILATLVLIALSERVPEAWGLPALAGLTAGLAAWTKNEGLLFAVVVVLAWSLSQLARGSRRATGCLLGGLAVALVPVLYFKIALAPSNDLVAGQSAERLGRLLDWSRHRLIVSAFWRDVSRFGEWRFAPFLALALPLAGSGWRRLNRREWLVAAVLALMLAGYYGVYLLTPQDLATQLEFSLVRLLLQLWPAAVFFWCLAAAGETAAPASAPVRSRFNRRFQLAAFGLANLALAGGVLAAFGRQLAPNELAAAHVGGGAVRAMVGEGWFARETDRSDTWLWSKGTATLRLRIDATQATTPVTLQFAMRSLGARTVTASIGDRIVWRGRVGEPLSPVEITGLALPGGTTTIVFATDEPGVLESADPGARALTFALYNLRLK
jgi:hypothetical protein